MPTTPPCVGAGLRASRSRPRRPAPRTPPPAGSRLRRGLGGLRPACELRRARAWREPAAAAAACRRRSSASMLAIWSLIDESSRWRSASWPSIDCRCAARSATTCFCAALARLSRDAALLDLLAEALHLAEHARVLGGDAVDGVEAVEEVVDRLGAEQDLERARVAASDVQRDEPLGEMASGRSSGWRARSPGGARSSAARPRSGRASRSRGCSASIACAELRVDLLDLREDALRLGLLRRDARVGGGGPDARQGDARRRSP